MKIQFHPPSEGCDCSELRCRKGGLKAEHRALGKARVWKEEETPVEIPKKLQTKSERAERYLSRRGVDGVTQCKKNRELEVREK